LGRLAKPTERKQGHYQSRGLSVVGTAMAGTPKPPPGLLKATQRGWERFWASDLAQFVTDSDRPALERLFQLRDDLERARRAYRRNPLVRGSKDQWVRNPVALDIAACHPQITALEDRFGLSPRSRLRLGITLGEAQATFADLHASLEEE
jgi:P27 family predicted phage terminase small subunit